MDMISNRKSSLWTQSQVERPKHEQNPELTDPIVYKILRRQIVMWPDSQLERIQVEKHPGGQTTK